MPASSMLIMQVVSCCARLRRMVDRLDRKPQRQGKIQLLRWCSNLTPTAAATMRLSQLAILRGQAFVVVCAALSWVVDVLFSERQTMLL